MKRLRVEDASGEREVLLIGKVMVGRDPVCTISAADALLSRHHAEFTPTPDGRSVRVRDLTSLNGIRVNDIPTTEALLVPGDVVRIAGLRIQYLDADDPAPDTSAAAAASHASPRTASKTVLIPDRGQVQAPPEDGGKP